MEEKLMTRLEAVLWSATNAKNVFTWGKSVNWYRISPEGELELSDSSGSSWRALGNITLLIMLSNEKRDVRKVRPEEWFDYEESKESHPLPDELSKEALRALWFDGTRSQSETLQELAQRILREVDRRIAASKPTETVEEQLKRIIGPIPVYVAASKEEK